MYTYIWEIPSYSLFACIGLFVMMLVIYYRCDMMNFTSMLQMIAFIITGVIIGSKGLFALTKLPDVIEDFSVKNILYVIITSGFVFYGGLFGAFIGAYIFSRIHHLNVRELFNMLSVGFAAFHVFGRIGCFLAGCCYGKVATWGFPVADDPSGALHVPIQLFESAMLVVIIMLILFKEYRIGTREYSCMLYLGLYAAGRFILEFYRGDDVRGIWGAFSTSQWISLIILCTILAKLITTNKQRVFRILNVAR